jgi:bifunctional DNA-binding transcriptional regulator/antitoxin component of YhaV-PrlF toxin-antitoxin module
MITTVTGKNQVRIPAELARRLGIEAGQRIAWEIGPEGALIGRLVASRGQLARQVAGMGRDWLEAGQDPIAELIEERGLDDGIEGLE